MACLFLPLNHFAGKVVVGAQDNLMKARDERVALMNEVCLDIVILRWYTNLIVDLGRHSYAEGWCAYFNTQRISI